MDELNDLKQLKNAKSMVKDLEESLVILEVAYTGLLRFKKYKNIYALTLEMKSYREILKNNLDKCNRIIDNKGKDV